MNYLETTIFDSAVKSPARYNVFCVIVTYADRRELLQQVLNVLPVQGVARVIVVDNGATWPVKDELTAAYGDFIDVVEMERNTGSAGGFAAGIQRAMELNATYLWLLDDDNRPQPGCLAMLLAGYNELNREYPADQLAVLAFRPENQADLSAGIPVHRINPRRNSFRGFHIRDIPYKFWRRTPWGRPRLQRELPPLMNLSVAPYSGFLLSKAAAEVMGLPREDFVLYEDDHEYTSRLTRDGGRLALVTGAVLEDLESSWSVREGDISSFGVLLNQGSDFRVYYCMRNGTYIDAHFRTCNSIIFGLNRRVYLTVLAILAFGCGRGRRYRLISDAVKNGMAGRLGLHPKLPL